MSHIKSSKTRLLFSSVVGLLLFISLWLSTYGINKTVDKTISVDVYENDDWSNITSSIKISGNLKKTLFSTSFVGTFAMDYYEPSCRDGVEAKIDWHGNDYQTISFCYAGDFSHLDVQMIDIDKDMKRMIVVLKDGTIITNYYISPVLQEFGKSIRNNSTIPRLSAFQGPPPDPPQPSFQRGTGHRHSEPGVPVSQSRRRK